MRIGIGNTIPERVSLPGQSGGGEVIPYEFKFKVAENTAGGAVTILAQPNSFGSFTIKWQDGTTQTSTGSTSITSPAGAGTISINKATDATWCDEFKIVSGQANVTEVVSWGENTWDKLDSAFENCVNLTTFGTATFKGTDTNASGVNLSSCFKGCSSLTSIDLTNWDLSNKSRLESFAQDCVFVESVFKPSSASPLGERWDSAFQNTGTSVTDGCTFNLDALNFGESTQSNADLIQSLFRNSKINPASRFTNWSSVSSLSFDNMFRDAQITGNDSTLHLSGWSNLNLYSFNTAFLNFNSGSTTTGVKVDLSNLKVTNIANSTFGRTGNSGLTGLFQNSEIYEIIGLNTWAAVGSNYTGSLSRFSESNKYLALDPNDNFSNAFMGSLKPTGDAINLLQFGTNLTNNYGAAPNLGSIDFTAITTFSSSFSKGRYSTNLDFQNVVFPSSATPTPSMFKDIKFSNSTSHIDIQNVFKTTQVNDLFNGAVVRKITLGDNVDLSSSTLFSDMFLNAKGSEDVSPATIDITLPTNMSFASANQTSSTTFLRMFQGVFGTGSTGTIASNWNALTSCQTNNLLRSLQNSLPSPGVDTDIVLDNCKYSGPQALVSNDYDVLISNGWTFGTLASEAPYFTLSSYSFPSGTTATATINAAYTGGIFTSSNTDIATVDASTGTVTTGADSGTCQIRYTLADGVCYNEVNLAVTIPLIANNFSFNFDGINDNLTMDPFDIPSPNSTLTMWFNSSDIGGPTGGNRVLTVLFSKQGRYFPYIDESAAGKIQIYVRDDAGSSIFTTSVDFNANEWYHLAITQSSTGLFFYINGQKMNSTALISRYPTALTRISGYPNNVYNLLGKIDEMAVWNATLTDAQILDIYNGRLGVTNETVDLSKYANLGGNLVYWNRMGD